MNKKPYKIQVGSPCYDNKEINSLIKTLKNGRISMGEKVKEFEGDFAKYIGKKYGIAVNSGTSANTLALDVLIKTGVLKKGDEVIVPAATFASVVSPVIQLGLRPVYVDVLPVSFNINPAEIERAITKKTKAVIVVHSLGVPADIESIVKITKKYKLAIIEDCCEAHGAVFPDGKKVGSVGDLSTFSFFVAHNITTGEGGMLLTNNKQYQEMACSLREFGRMVKKGSRFAYRSKFLGNYDKKYVFENVGYNIRMTDLTASLGIEQLKKLDRLNAARRKIVSLYLDILEDYKDKLYFSDNCYKDNAYYGFLLIVKPGQYFKRLDLVRFLEDSRIETRPFFAGCLPDQPAFRNQPKRIVGKLPVSRYLKDNAFFIGCHPNISNKNIKHFSKTLEEFFICPVSYGVW